MRTGDHSREYATCQPMRAWRTSNYTRTTKDMDGRLKAVFSKSKPVGRPKNGTKITSTSLKNI